jgi:hypothetical protein
MTAVSGNQDRATGQALGQNDGAGRRQRRIDAFHPCYRRFVAELTACSPELEDLADSFPGLLFALVSGYGSPQQRERALDLVNDGAPLREAADALGLAWWLRKLPVQAFTAPLPAFPSDPEFTFRIAGLVPADASFAPVWLTRVSHALEACGPDYALWLARQSDLSAPPEQQFMFMAAWAWFSGRPGLLGHRLLRRPWSGEMSFKRARDEVAAWRQRLRLIESLGPGIEHAWLADGSAAGFSFVALRTVEDFIAESEALENCLDQYADQLDTGLTAIFSIRKGGRRVACVEIGVHDEEVSMPAIVQLRGVRNRRAPPEVWQATFSWLGSQRLEPLSPLRHVPKPLKRIEARRELWRPYLEALAASRHEPAFRRIVYQPTRQPGPDPRRMRLLPRRAADPRTGPPATGRPRQRPPAPVAVRERS